MVTHGVLLLRRDDAFSAIGTNPIALPKCRLADAWKAAQGKGLPKNVEAFVAYADPLASFPGKGPQPYWQISMLKPTVKEFRIDGATCAPIGG
jgi:hypothetical protein